MPAAWKKIFFEKRSLLVVSLLFIIYCGGRLWLVAEYGDVAFGYDTGIYRRVVDDYAAGIRSEKTEPFGFVHFSSSLRALGSSIDEIMYGWYMVFAALLFWGVYAYTQKNAGEESGVWAALLLAASVVQFEFFWWYYYRNLIALALWFVVLLLIRRRSYMAVVPLLAIGIVHPLSLLPLGCALIVGAVLLGGMRGYLLKIGFATLACLAVVQWPEYSGYLPTLLGHGWQTAAAERATSAELTGQFIALLKFLGLTILYLPLALFGFARAAKKISLESILAGVCMVLVGLHVIFYRRLYIFIDVIAIMYAAQALAYVRPKISWHYFGKMLLGVYIVSLFVYAGRFTMLKKPLITPTELLAIQELQQVPREAYIVSFTSFDAPWLYGFTNHTVLAPGVFKENKWNREEWNTFWTTPSSTIRHELLRRYPAHEFYIYAGARNGQLKALLQNEPRAENINEHVWKYTF